MNTVDIMYVAHNIKHQHPYQTYIKGIKHMHQYYRLIKTFFHLPANTKANEQNIITLAPKYIVTPKLKRSMLRSGSYISKN